MPDSRTNESLAASEASAVGAALVSVVLPTRDRSALLDRALSSVVQQTFRDLEIIVVDDASSDGTYHLLEKWRDLDSRIRILSLSERQGGAAARNCGIAAARGSWIAFIDDDDEWLPGKLEYQLQAARRSDAGLVYCPAMFVGKDGRERLLQCNDIPSEGARRALLNRNFVSTPTVLVRKDVLARIGGFDESLPRLQDWDLWIRLAAVTPFTYVPLPLVRAHHTPGGISTRSDALRAACDIVDRKYRHAEFDVRELADFQHALGHILMIGGASGGGAYLWRAARIRPTLRRFAMAALGSISARAYLTVSRLHEQLVRIRLRVPVRTARP